MGTFATDVKLAFRTFRRSPGFTATAVAALALGIGANTAIFSVVDTVLLKPLPYPQADRIVVLMNTSPQGSGPAASVPKYNVWRKQTQALEDVAAYDTGGPGLNLSGGDRPEQIKGIHVSHEFFRLFGAQPAIGRTFTPEEDRPRGGNVAVLSNGIWQRRFGSDPSIVGKTIALGGESVTIVGVLDRKFAFDPQPDVYLPFQADPNSTNQGHYFRVAAHLKPGVTIGAAKSAMNLAAEEFRRLYPNNIGSKNSFTVEFMQQLMVRDVRTALFILLGAVGCVLLIACANVANLLLARAATRSRDIAIRCAIGAGRGRIMRELLTESVLLSLMGGIAGLIIGVLGVRALLAINPGNIPRIGEDGSAIALNWSVLGFTMLLSLITGALFGLAPAVLASRADLNLALKESASRGGTGLGQAKARGALVVVEMALAIVLLVGAGLLIRTFSALHSVAPGFDPHNVLTMDTALTGSKYDQTAVISEMTRQALDRMHAIPGLEAAAATSYLPLEGGLGLGFIIQGRPLTNGPVHGGTGWNYVTSRFFDVFRVPVIRGRVFTERDDAAAFLRWWSSIRPWPASIGKMPDPIGQRLIIRHPGMGPDFHNLFQVALMREDHHRHRGRRPRWRPEQRSSTRDVRAAFASAFDSYMKLNNRFMPLRSWVARTHVEPVFASARDSQRAFPTNGSRFCPSRTALFRTMDRIVIQSTPRATRLQYAGVGHFRLDRHHSSHLIGLYGLMKLTR